MNPYKVLGVTENATSAEIRKAYLNLVKKYHPDKYSDSDLKELANEKLKEVNEAYDLLSKNRGTSNAGSGRAWSGSGAYNGAGSSYSGPNAEAYARIRMFISQNDLSSAKRILDSTSARDAEWYYLYGIIYFREGWHNMAVEHFETAYNMNPNNVEYANAYNSVFSTGGFHRGGEGRRYQSGGGSSGCSTCDVCAGLLCADCCCECMGGDLIRCC